MCGSHSAGTPAELSRTLECSEVHRMNISQFTVRVCRKVLSATNHKSPAAKTCDCTFVTAKNDPCSTLIRVSFDRPHRTLVLLIHSTPAGDEPRGTRHYGRSSQCVTCYFSGYTQGHMKSPRVHNFCLFGWSYNRTNIYYFFI